MNAKLLGKKRNYYQDQLDQLWGIHNNIPYSQHRNLVERKISNLKRLIREGIFGTPGPQSEAIDRSILDTTIAAATNMMNNTPYLESGPNNLLLAPADFLTPWRGTQPEVQRLPEHDLRSLADARRTMIVRQEKLKELAVEEIRRSKSRFKSGRLKLGKNKSSPMVEVGGVVLLTLDSKTHQLGVVTTAGVRDVTVQFRGGRVASLPMGQCIPVTPGRNNMTSRLNEPMSHFLSLEIQRNKLLEIFSGKLNVLQEDLAQVPDIGKPAKTTSVHITVAALNIRSEELEMVTEKIDTAIKKYIDVTNPTTGLIVGFQGIGFGDDAMWVSMTLGAESLKMLRELIEDEAESYIIDNRFSPHLTIYRKCATNEEVKEGVKSSVREIKLGCLTIEAITLRGRKVGSEVPEPHKTWSLMGL